MKVQIRNYQRIKKASLEFVPGLNVIIGQTNNGKSSIIRSLETAIYNISREGHVTLGETKSAVGIEYNGHQVIWRRDTEASSQVTYRVDGKIYGKLGRGQPEVVKEALGISEVEINETKFRVNFSKQMSYPFLLNVTPSELFKFIVQSSEEDNVVEVLNEMRSDVNEISSNVKKYDEARNSLGVAYQREVSRFKEKKPLLPYCEEVLNIEGKVKSVKRIRELIESYEKCRYVVQKSEQQMKSAEIIKGQIDKATGILDDLVIRQDKLASMVSEFNSSLNTKENTEDNIREKSKILDTYLDLNDYIEMYTSLETRQSKCDTLKKLVNSYETSEKMNGDSSLELSTVIEELERVEKVSTAIGRALVKLEEKNKDVNHIKELNINFSSSVSTISILNEELKKQKDELAVTEEQINEIGVCPYCGSELKGGSHEHN